MLLLGVGNPLRGDDGVGPEVAARVARLGLPGLEVATEIDPLALLDHLGNPPAHESIVVVDATTPNGEPGRVRVHRVDARRLAARDSPFGSHGLGVAHAVELARALGLLPERLILIGVEAESTRLGDGLSAAVLAAVDSAVRAVTETPVGPPVP